MFTNQGDDTLFEVTASGELDMGTLPGWQEQLDLAERADTAVLVDLSDVEFMDSRGLAALLRAREQIVTARRRFGLVCDPEGAVQRLLAVTGTLPLFQPYDTRESAQHHLRAGN